MKKRLIRIITLVFILAVITFFVLRRIGVFDAQAETSDPGMDSRAIPVEVVVVQPLTIEEKITATGTVTSNEEVIITSESSGKVTGIYFTEGTAVKKGQLLIKINDSELQARREKAKHQYELAKQQEERQKQLLDKEAISRDTYERTVTEVRGLSADISLIEAQIAKTEIRAPFTGVIGLRQVSNGAFIAPGTPVAQLTDFRTVKIDFNVPARYSGLIKKGTRINFELENTGMDHTARVIAIEPRINPDTRTFTVRAEYDNRGLNILPGAYTEVAVVLNEIDSTLIVPNVSIIPELGGQKIFLVEEGKAISKQVHTGIRYEGNIQVVRGLNPGDTVIVTGVMQVRTGAPVEISNVLEITGS